jgi:hypothetical protein
LLVVPEQSSRAEAVRPLIRRSLPRAEFPDGTQVRQLVTRSVARDRELRKAAGRRLVSDVQVRLTPGAWSMLARGRVDLRLVALIDRLTPEHSIDVAGFPRTAEERAAGAPARSMLVTAIDGALVADGGPAVTSMRGLLDQPGSLSPAQISEVPEAAPTALLVRMLLPEPMNVTLPASPSPEGD